MRTDTQKQKRRIYKKTPSGKLQKYKENAKNRGLSFELDFEFFNSLLKQNCHYCGIKNANGVDRIDSLKNYTLENVLPCCKTCNTMKMALPYKSFINQIKIIYKNLLKE